MTDGPTPNYEELAFLALVVLSAILYHLGGWWQIRVRRAVDFWEQVGPVLLRELAVLPAPPLADVALALG